MTNSDDEYGSGSELDKLMAQAFGRKTTGRADRRDAIERKRKAEIDFVFNQQI